MCARTNIQRFVNKDRAFSSFSAVKRYDALAALGAAGIVDLQKLAKWIGKSTWHLFLEPVWAMSQ